MLQIILLPPKINNENNRVAFGVQWPLTINSKLYKILQLPNNPPDKTPVNLHQNNNPS